ncbi:MAG: hypothetical protein SGCHY_002423 [Lobulomycetales sp.]
MFSRSLRPLSGLRTSALPGLRPPSLVASRGFSDKLFVHRDTPENNASIPFELTPENATRADAIISQFPPQYKKAAVIPVLDLAQRQNGNFCSLSVMQSVARLLDMPPMRVYEVATFYTMFNREPVGRYFLQICGTTPCELCGARGVIEAVCRELGVKVGQTTPDGLFTVAEVECAGACVNAPVMAVNDDYFEDLTAESVVKLLKDLRSGKSPKPGPQSGRRSCENSAQRTSLTGTPTGPGFGVRADL